MTPRNRKSAHGKASKFFLDRKNRPTGGGPAKMDRKNGPQNAPAKASRTCKNRNFHQKSKNTAKKNRKCHLLSYDAKKSKIGPREGFQIFSGKLLRSIFAV
eukprot:161114_1